MGHADDLWRVFLASDAREAIVVSISFIRGEVDAYAYTLSGYHNSERWPMD